MLMSRKSMNTHNQCATHSIFGFDNQPKLCNVHSLSIFQINRIVYQLRYIQCFCFFFFGKIQHFVCLSRWSQNYVSKMNRNRGKCVFNCDLAKKYPFIKKDLKKSGSDVKCDICGANFNIANKGKTSIDQHVGSDKHKKRMNAAANSHTVQNMFTKNIDYPLAAREGAWTYHVIKSNESFRSSDCASKLIRTCFGIENFHCARTKCEAIATNVLAPYAEKKILNELLDRHYVCLTTDASNHGNIKMMPIVVRYFIPTIGIQVKLLEFATVKGESSEIIASLIINTAEQKQIVGKIVGFSADNCPTNFGSRDHQGKNNVYYRLKEHMPGLLGIGCCAHICHNTLKHACDCLPIDVECIVVKIYSHFYIHTVRVEALKAMCELSKIEYSQLLGYANTRFLALGKAIRSILKLFEPLKSYFLGLKRCPPIIKSFFESPLSKLWFLFIHDQVKLL